MLVHEPKVAGGPAELDATVSAVDPAELLQSSHKRRHAGLNFGVALGPRHQQTDPPHPAQLLRARRERPRGGTAENRDELAASHSINSSARRRSGSGIVRPRSWAVVRLMTRSNLVGCSTGRSPGFAPRRILSTKSAVRRNISTKFAP